MRRRRNAHAFLYKLRAVTGGHGRKKAPGGEAGRSKGDRCTTEGVYSFLEASSRMSPRFIMSLPVLWRLSIS